MRLMQTFTFYDRYLAEFCARHPELEALDYENQMRLLRLDGFAAGQILTPVLPDLGYETFLAVMNYLPAQGRWAMEHGLSAPRSRQEQLALLARQVEEFRPDILYLGDPILTDGRWVRSLTWKPRLVVGWRQAEIPPGTDWQGYDLMLSGDEAYRKTALALGARASEPYRPGFPGFLADLVADVPEQNDVVFTGQITRDHGSRLRCLSDLAKAAATGEPPFGLALFLAAHSPVPEELSRLDQGARWGLDMYRCLKAGRIVLNVHIDLTVPGVNFRIIETAGVGGFLLTEAGPELNSLFAPGREVETYTGIGELVEKIRHYLDRPAERKAMARRAQERCLRDHCMEARAAWFNEIMRSHL